MRRIYCMSCNIIVTPEFSRSLKKLAKHYKSMKDDFAYFLDQLRENPWMGTDLGQGLHKVRLSITSKGKGKSGGARVITLVTVHTDENDQVLLLAIYDKSERENLSDKELNDLLYRYSL